MIFKDSICRFFFLLLGSILFISTNVSAASEGYLEVGKLWVSPTVTNYGYMGVFEYPGGAKDFYIIEQANFFSGVIEGDTVVLYGGSLGNELDFGWQNADSRYEDWVEQGDGINRVHLSANSNFSNTHTGDLQLEVISEILAFNHPDYDDFVIIKHSFVNTGTTTITDFYYGSHLPVDVGVSGISYKDLDDYGEHRTESGLTYMYDDDGDNGFTPYYTGQILLGVDSGSGPDTSDNWTTAHFYQMVNPISGKDDLLSKITSGLSLSSGSPGPWSILNAVGPFEIASGVTVSFSMAVVYGKGLPGILTNASAAKRLATDGFSLPLDARPPPVPELVNINIASQVIELIWSNTATQVPDFKSFRIYKSDVSTIGPWSLLADTTDTNIVDIGRSGFPLYYTITSVDHFENETGKWGRASRTLEAVRPLGKSKPNVDEVLVVPNPYLGGVDWETEDYENRLYFTNLPKECTIYIYSIMGDLVAKLPHNLAADLSSDGSGWEDWDLLSRNRQTIASGMYLFRVVTPEGEEATGKFVVVKGER